MSGPSSTGAWHVDDDALRGWVDGRSGPLVSVSVEAHLLRCPRCRAEVAGLVPEASVGPVWDRVLAEVEVPRPGRAEHLLKRLGLSPSDARVIASAVTLRTAWWFGVLGVLAFTVLAALLAHDGGVALFLVAAPLIPVAGVAVAYGPESDPSFEVVLAAPYAMVRLVMLRTAWVLATSVPLVVVAGLWLPTSPVVAVAWLLPAAGFVAVVLTSSTWVNPAHAATAVALAWVVVVALAVRSGDPLLVFAPAALVTYLAILTVAGLTLLYRILGAAPSWRLR